MSDSIIDEIHAWAKATFPAQSNPRIARHLVEETEESEAALADGTGHEVADGIADCFILLSELCCRLEETAEAYGIDVAEAVRVKHEVNKRRRWVNSGRGYDRHGEEEVASHAG